MSGALPSPPTARYETILRLASGGMATVWVGTVRGALGFRQLVAIKKPHPHLLSDPNFRGELLAEARLASMIRHANVVDVRDVEIDGESISLVMDYIEGASLGELLVAASKGTNPSANANANAAASSTRIPARVAVRIIRDACAGLHAAHELVDERDRPVGLVHRDVSPQNVLVGTDGISRVTDFGVAKFSRKNMQSTSEGSLKGKLAYMAPEYVRGEEIDRRFDVFACGVVLWEALTGKRCFRGENEAETLRRLLDHVPEPASKAAQAPELEPLDGIVACALAKDRNERFQNAAAMGAALEGAASEVSLMGSHTEVASLLKELAGRAIEERRSLVRAKLANEPSVASLMGHPPIEELLKAGADGGGIPATALAPTLEEPPKVTVAVPTPIGVASLPNPSATNADVPPTRIAHQHPEPPLGPTLPIGGVVAAVPTAPATEASKAATPKMGGAAAGGGNTTVGAASAVPSTQPMTPHLNEAGNSTLPNGSPRTLASAPPLKGPAGGTTTKPSPQVAPPPPPQQSPQTLASAPPIGARGATNTLGFGAALQQQPHHPQPQLTLRSEDTGPSDPPHQTQAQTQTQTQTQPQPQQPALHGFGSAPQHTLHQSSEHEHALASAFPVSAPPRRSLLPFIITAFLVVGAVVVLILVASRHTGSGDGTATTATSASASANASASAPTTQPLVAPSPSGIALTTGGALPTAPIPSPTTKTTPTSGTTATTQKPRGHSTPTTTPSAAPIPPPPPPPPIPTPTSTIKKPPDNPYNN